MDAVSELAQIATRLENLAHRGDQAEIARPLERLQRSAEEVGKSASGSWLGYHAYVYFEGLKIPPSSARFDQWWGFMNTFSNRTSGHWMEYRPEIIVEAIHKRAGNPDLAPARIFDDEACEEIEVCKSDMLSILQIHINQDDPFLEDVRRRINDVALVRTGDVIKQLSPKGQLVTYDSLASGQETRTPPHFSVFAEVVAMNQTRGTIVGLIRLVKETMSHLSRKQIMLRPKPTTGTNVFIGHGHSAAWRELKDFIEDRLQLPTDEFNRVPVAGVSHVARLGQMLSSAAMAFLVMTGEDERRDGTSHARLNVIHEAGLFQGKIGFECAIVLLEEGCEEFSNIAGLGQVRFPKGQIRSTFEEVRRILEREGLVKAKRE